MIFGRKKAVKVEEIDDEVQEVLDDDSVEEPEAEATSEQDQAELWDQAFDRAEGPFDGDEVDLDADDVKRLDFGALVVTPFDGMSLQLQAEPQERRIQSVLIGDGESALEVAVFAGPSKSSMNGEVREEIIAATKQQQGTCEVVEGPFGAEIRRAVPVKDPEGNPALHLSRTWLVSGPGWLLRGVLIGKAALEPDNEEAQLRLFECFSNLVVRRENSPTPPGRVLFLKVPDVQG